MNSVCVIMPPSCPDRMISCSRDNSPTSSDDPGYLGSSRIRKFPESLVRMPRAERQTQIWTVRHVPPPSPSSPPLHLIPAPYTPPTPPLPLSPCGPVVPCGVRMQAHCGPVACCGMRLQAPSPSPRSGRIVSGRPGRIGGRRRRRRRRRPSDGPGRAARPAVPRAPHRSWRIGSRACLIGPSFVSCSATG